MGVIPDQRQREETAYHEAGHAVACYVLKYVFEEVSIIRGEGFEGKLYANGIPEDLKERLVQKEILSPVDTKLIHEYIIISWAGFASEYRFTGKPNLDGSTRDLRLAYLLAFHLDRPDKEYEEEAKELIYSNWKKVEAVAQALLESQTLTAQQVQEICETPIG